MKVWAEHRASTGAKVTCPLCRTDWGALAVHDLRDAARGGGGAGAGAGGNGAGPAAQVHRGCTCRQCGATPIRGRLYRLSLIHI